MSIKTNELPQVAAFEDTDSILVDTDEKGTGRVSFSAASTFFRKQLLGSSEDGVYTKSEIDTKLNALYAKSGGAISGNVSINGALSMTSLTIPTAQGAGNLWIA